MGREMKTVLSIGQCRPDQAAISHFLTTNFDVKVVSIDLADEVKNVLNSQQFDLVLINRKLDADYSDGMPILEAIKADLGFVNIPVMLVSNFVEWQEKAVQKGAVYGFGKRELSISETKQRVAAALNLQ